MEKHQLIFTLFGATGDLAYRKLYPAIYRLYKKHYLSTRFAVIGTGRREWDHDFFRNIVLDSIDDEIDNLPHAIEFTQHFYYQSHDVRNIEEYDTLKKLIIELDNQYKTKGNRLFYISLSPELFPIITENLYKTGISDSHGYSKLIIEKPFGYDYTTAKQLQDELSKYFDEEQIYRIDHYLGKSIINSLLHFRMTNHIFDALWNKEHIQQIQITLAEEVGIEDRGEYYDASGVSRDMIQNHMMQLISLIAMRRPNSNDNDSIRQAKIDVIKNINFYHDLTDFKASVVRGQYDSDINHKVKSYRQEDNINPNSMTPTFFAGIISLNLPEWEGVPFFIRSGKRMHKKVSVIHIEFKAADDISPSNRLTIEISPDMSYKLFVNYKSLGYNHNTQIIALDTKNKIHSEDIPHDYERLILECLNGKLESFSHWLEVAFAWRFIDHIHEFWESDPVLFPNYLSYSSGPIEADYLLTNKGYKWID